MCCAKTHYLHHLGERVPGRCMGQVKKRASERKEREVGVNQPKLKPTKAQMAEKKIKALNKKLSSIESLIERQAAGEELDEQQLAKIETLEDTLEELEAFMSGDRS